MIYNLTDSKGYGHICRKIVLNIDARILCYKTYNPLRLKKIRSLHLGKMFNKKKKITVSKPIFVNLDDNLRDSYRIKSLSEFIFYLKKL